MNWKSSSCPFQTTFLSAYVVNSCGLWAADLVESCEKLTDKVSI